MDCTSGVTITLRRASSLEVVLFNDFVYLAAIISTMILGSKK